MDPKKALRDQLLDWKSWGVDVAPSRGQVQGKADHGGPPGEGTAARPGLDDLRIEVAACRQCGLANTRTRTVFCSGKPSPLMFVGEAPGEDEDATGEAFVGAAGKMLTRVLKDAGISRDQIYIANVLKCRPPGNRPPAPAEVESCAPFLRRQIELVNPKVICALGKPAAFSLLGWEGPMRNVRGTWRLIQGRWITATYHPSYLLRSRGDIDTVLGDFKAILDRLAALGATL